MEFCYRVNTFDSIDSVAIKNNNAHQPSDKSSKLKLL